MRKRKKLNLCILSFDLGEQCTCWREHVGCGLLDSKKLQWHVMFKNLFFHHCKYWSWKTLANVNVNPSCHNNWAYSGPSVPHHILLAPLACGSPPPLEHGDIRETRKFLYNHNEGVQYLCLQYYTMEGRPDKTCNNGEWVGEEIKCYSKLPSMIHSNCFMTQRVLQAGENTNKRLQFDQSCTD